MQRILSLIQPTGELHLGNYFGAIQNWKNIQDTYTCFYGVADYHSMTMPYQANELRENTWRMVFQLLACEIKPEKLFVQSMVPEHVELCWILSCVCSFGELSKMTQFKDKIDQLKNQNKDVLTSAGLFLYPVLQAADILIYHADFVPVGKDQEQHLELARNIAERFNFQFGKEYFKAPAPLFTEIQKLLSPADPEKKMSKSLGEKHVINVFGDEATIRKQIKSAVTDTGNRVEGEMSAGVKNLFTLLQACGNMESYNSLLADFNNAQLKYSQLKEAVADTLILFLAPFNTRYTEILENKKNFKLQIQESSASIRLEAQKTLKEVREITGMMSLKM